MMNKVTVCHENTGWHTSLSHASDSSVSFGAATSLKNLCKDFAFPPPPPGDRRRIGHAAIAYMPRNSSASPVLHHLTYISEENPIRTERPGGSEFGGYPSLEQRNDSFDIKESMTVHCGFVKGCRPVCHENTGWHTSLSHASDSSVSFGAATSLKNLCKDFAFPPPPPGDRRRIGHAAIAYMPRNSSASPVLHHLTYISEENPIRTERPGGSEFGGYPSLEQRNDSFDIKESMTVHCGFVKGCRPGDCAGFDLDVADLRELEQFHEVIVASAIFGNYDLISTAEEYW
ncbi:uncharacterized protein LOC111380393 [Olea europaea subsp. europaea]|uniref:Uncharacterized protein LOC111380393 n=1 Tax=Olea europaea subsp. europaea TaxID=158383 RepID=A0A8S0TUW3_OLEEU|nr:uncharacterized protein LOC111380393 [Olea europaea subsp. europaea]